MEKGILKTPIGEFKGNERENCFEYLGIPYAKAKRFEYAEEINGYDKVDATKFGPACPQYRQFFPHLDVPERLFYQKEFRDGLEFVYDEDCLNLNIYTPKQEGSYPVLVYIHGGGFNSMCNSESYLDGEAYTSRGIILVVINYRVGVFGYLTDPEIKKSLGREGNFGLDDMLVALSWVKHHIDSFGGDPSNISVMGQSAGAISLQYLCLSPLAQGLFNRAIMLSGAGAFPKFALPLPAEKTNSYWEEVKIAAKVNSFEEFKALGVKEVLSAVEMVKANRKDNLRNTMPVIDGYLIKEGIDKLIKHPLKLDYMVGYTNNDMFTFILSNMAHKYSKHNGAYLYFFDVDAPGDDNEAFHSSDLRYVFDTLDKSWRPYDEEDNRIAKLMCDYIASFIKSGDPNGDNRPTWIKGKRPLCISKKKIGMGKRPTLRLIRNTFKGDPK
ncbi:MAG: carboxylesterase family protein [Bacilli bacterium]|nr:carboxylesterase family protein [Bacilli bacterium]